jgi:predicted  nucleic acid-binding Zn ribbon protein
MGKFVKIHEIRGENGLERKNNKLQNEISKHFIGVNYFPYLFRISGRKYSSKNLSAS